MHFNDGMSNCARMMGLLHLAASSLQKDEMFPWCPSIYHHLNLISNLKYFRISHANSCASSLYIVVEKDIVFYMVVYFSRIKI